MDWCVCGDYSRDDLNYSEGWRRDSGFWLGECEGIGIKDYLVWGCFEERGSVAIDISVGCNCLAIISAMLK